MTLHRKLSPSRFSLIEDRVSFERETTSRPPRADLGAGDTDADVVPKPL